jgi:hypothetical protein
VALTTAISRDLQYRARLAGVLGGGAALITWLLNGFLVLERPPTLAGAALGGAAFGIAAIVAFSAGLLVAPAKLRALEAIYSAARFSAQRFRAASGDARVPGTPGQARAWLARHPDRDETRGARVFAQLVVGDLAAAHELAAHLPTGTAMERFNRAGSLTMIRLVEGEETDLGPMRELAAALVEADDRLLADVDIALIEGLAAAADGRDWVPLMVVLRERIGPRGDGALVRGLWLPIVALLLAGAALLSLGAYGIRLLIG